MQELDEVTVRQEKVLLNFLLITLVLCLCCTAFAQNPEGYAQHLSRLDASVAVLHERAKADTDSWFKQEQLARAYLDRARISGSSEDYAAAELHLARAFELAPEGAGPFMTRAMLHYALHRFAASEQDLERASARLLIDDRDRADMLGLAGDLAFQRGDHDQALGLYREARELSHSSSHLFRLFHYYWKTQDWQEAEAMLDAAMEAQGNSDAQMSSFFHLHYGFLDFDRSRYDEALAHYLEAEQVYPGWWLIQRHIDAVCSITACQ